MYQFVNRGRGEGAIRRFRWDGQCFYQGVEKRGDGWSRGASTGEINFRVTFLAKKKTGDACNRSRYIRANPGRRRGEATRNRRNEDKWITFRSLLCKNIPEPRFADYLYLDLWIKSLIFPPPGFRSIQCIYDVIRRFDLRCLPRINVDLTYHEWEYLDLT